MPARTEFVRQHFHMLTQQATCQISSEGHGDALQSGSIVKVELAIKIRGPLGTM